MEKNKEDELPEWKSVFYLMKKWKKNLLDIGEYICNFDLPFYNKHWVWGLSQPEDSQAFMLSFLRDGSYVFKSKDIEQFEIEHPELLHPTDTGLKEEYKILQEGPSWTIIYEGKVLRGLKNKGFELIHYLILNERKVFHIDELRIEFDKTLPNEEKSLTEIDLNHSNDDREAIKGGIDFRAKIYGDSMKELKAHRAYLQDELRKANKDNDPARKAKFEEEFEEFEKYCNEYFGLKGKSRKDRDNTIKTKDRICKRIERALNNIKKHDDNTWRHFHNALRPINSYFQSYQPDRDIDWLT